MTNRIVGRVALVLGLCQAITSAELAVQTNFPGGSAAVSEIDEEAQLIVVDPTLHLTKGWRCWWYFKVAGVRPNQPLIIDIGEAPWATPDRAHFSLDNQTWAHTEPGKRDGKRIRYQLSIDATEVWLAWGPPFVPADAHALVDDAAASSKAATAFNFCHTRERWETPALRITAPEGIAADRQVVWIQARQHAWEAGSSWVAKGLIDWLVSDDRSAAALRERAEIVVVPIMDIDNVRRGAGGKDQQPRDHNRDWSAAPHWRSVATAQKHLRAADEAGRLALFIDLHNPGAQDRQPYFYISPTTELSPIGRQNLANFLADAQTEIVGPLRFSGRTVESGAKYDPRAWNRISKNWVTANCDQKVVSVTLETAWNTKASTIDGYEAVGRQLGKTIGRYFLRTP